MVVKENFNYKYFRCNDAQQLNPFEIKVADKLDALWIIKNNDRVCLKNKSGLHHNKPCKAFSVQMIPLYERCRKRKSR